MEIKRGMFELQFFEDMDTLLNRTCQAPAWPTFQLLLLPEGRSGGIPFVSDAC